MEPRTLDTESLLPLFLKDRKFVLVGDWGYGWEGSD